MFVCMPRRRKTNPALSATGAGAAPPARGLEFLDDFSNPDLARYYEIVLGVGAILRREEGLHYDISRAPDGPSSAADYLSIDSLGRPQSPTAKAVLRFAGSDWTLEACIEYDVGPKSNGRSACFWLIHGDAADRYDESIELVRSADLGADSHRLAIVVYDRSSEPQSIDIARIQSDRYWLRLARSGERLTASWRQDGGAYQTMLERSLRSASPSHTVLMNSSSFVGGASYVLRSIRLSGARPIPLEWMLFT